ncbi:serine/threonine protein kinase [Hyalangium versicolor]|uniref:serine/threonine protein kinase n=1 Tax=Hyalangium versicolor TaxID=2861190 RepID=UPI001CD00C38|nr:serine/threonine-protein kinase [Hyalangium versicolor]
MQLSKSYQLIKKLASGGMAEVFLARTEGPLGFSKTLVLKRILPHLADDEQFIQMFLEEARLVAQLSHPNVVHIFDFGEFEGSYCIAMEYIDGPNLRVLSRQARNVGVELSPVLCAKMISYACEGLAYAHDLADPRTGKPLGLVHRDVSSDNILISRTGTVKVVDFGVAKVIGQNHRTKAGIIKGKLPYMPPEQIRGRPLDRRVDVYALGVVLYELLAHKRPYDATGEVAIMNAILYEQMKPLQERRPDIPEALARITERCLAKEREDRYPSCRHLRMDLERFIHSTGEPVGTDELASLVTRVLEPEKEDSARTGPASNKTPPPPVRSSPPPASGPRRVKTPTSSPNVAARAVGTGGAASPELRPEPALEMSRDMELITTAPRQPTGIHQGRAGLIAVSLGCLTIVAALGAFFVLRQSHASPANEEPAAHAAAPHAPEPAVPLETVTPQKPAPREEKPTPAPMLEPSSQPPAPPEPSAVIAKASVPSDGGTPDPLKQEGEKKKRSPPTDRSATRLALAMDATGRDLPETSETPEAFEQPKPPPPVPETPPAPETHEAPPVPTPSVQPLPLASVVLESSPPAQIRINGQFAGFASATVSRLPPGPVHVEVYDSVKGLRKRQTIVLEPGDNGVQRILVEQGTLELRIVPFATVYVDGKLLGVTPLGPISLYEGTHDLRLENTELGKSLHESFTIEPGKTLVLKYSLEEKP